MEKKFRHKIIPRTKKKSTWLYISIVLGVLLIISLFWGSFGSSKSNVAEKIVSYINNNLLEGNTRASIVDVKEVGGVYRITLDINGQSFDSYVTKDGSLLFTTGIEIDEKPSVPSKRPTSSNTQKVDVSVDDDAIKGDKNAPVTIIEFSDFECPFCGRYFSQTFSQIEEKYIKTGKVRYVFRDFPLSFHRNAQKASEASECADDQGKFWEMHDKLFENQNALSVINLKQYAQELGLELEKFNTCLDSGKYKEEVQKDFGDGQSYGISGTPGFFINGVLLSGAQPFSAFEQIIEEELAK